MKILSSYWTKRMESALYRAEQEAFHAEVNLLRQFQIAKNDISKSIKDLLQKDDGTSFSSSYLKRKFNLDVSSLSEASISELFPGYKRIDDGGVSYLVKENEVLPVTRKMLFDKQLEYSIEKLRKYQDKLAKKTLERVYKESYYRTMFDFQQGLGYAFNFATLDQKAIDVAVNTKWCQGENYSDRIWKNKALLQGTLKKTVQQGIIKGEDISSMIKTIEHDMGVQYSAAQRLVRTEVNHIYNLASNNSYRESGAIEEYEYVATLDDRTSDICRSLDGKVFSVDDFKPGENAPPMHPNCRCVTIPKVSYNQIETRAARDPSTGKTISVENLSYDEWYKGYVEPPQSDSWDPDREMEDLTDLMNRVSSIDADDIVRKGNLVVAGESEALEKYTESSNLVNGYLRQTPEIYDEMEEWSKEEAREQVEEIQSVIDKKELLEDIPVYRGVSSKTACKILLGDRFDSSIELPLDEFIGNLDKAIEKESAFYEKAFMSTSIDYEQAMKFSGGINWKPVFVAKAKKGMHAAFLADISAYSVEDELLFGQGRVFRIIGYDVTKERGEAIVQIMIDFLT